MALLDAVQFTVQSQLDSRLLFSQLDKQYMLNPPAQQPRASCIGRGHNKTPPISLERGLVATSAGARLESEPAMDTSAVADTSGEDVSIANIVSRLSFLSIYYRHSSRLAPLLKQSKA